MSLDFFLTIRVVLLNLILNHLVFDKQIQFNFFKIFKKKHNSKHNLFFKTRSLSNLIEMQYLIYYQIGVIQTCLIIQYKMSINQKSYSRIHWTIQEEKMLKQLREDKKMQSWKMISKIINKTFKQKSRSGKQCRQRYTNYIKFNEGNRKINDWTPEEDLLLFNSFVFYGPKWVKISKKMPGRSQNCLKNRFYGAIRKLIRKIQKIQKQKNKRVRKSLKPENIIKYLQNPSDELNCHKGQSQLFLQKIRSKILQLIICVDQTIENQKIQQLILLQENYHNFYKEIIKKSELNSIRSGFDRKDTQGEGTNDQGQKSLRIFETPQKIQTQIRPNKVQNECTKLKITQNFIITLNNNQEQQQKRKIENQIANRDFYMTFLYYQRLYNPSYNL